MNKKELFPAWYQTRPEDEVVVRAWLLHARAAEYSPDHHEGLSTLVVYGPPGTGKTSLGRAVAEAQGWEILYFLAHHWVSEEDLFGTIDPARVAALAGGIEQDGEDAYVLGVLARAALLSWGQPLVLILDEWDKAPERADALLLSFLQDGQIVLQRAFAGAIRSFLGRHFPGKEAEVARTAVRIWGGQIHVRAKKDALLVLITSNGVRPISEPLLRRGIRHEMGFLPPEVEADILRRETGVPMGAARLIVRMMNLIRAMIPEGASAPSLYEGKQLARAAQALRRGEMGDVRNPAEVLNVLIRVHLVKNEVDAEALWGQLKNPGAILWGELGRD